ncbi:hypothetical protein [Streptomyces sp. NPDC096339]|uniref:hypothetical protein n=1 Tax=Streptomyces sp. NPDC096339 TaxID=3366086 RepID=UPI0038189707
MSPDEHSGVLLYGLGVRKMMSPEPTPPGALPLGGGVTGWVSRQLSWIRLSEECGFEMGGTGGGVLLELKITPAAGPQDVDSVRAALLDISGDLARKHHCPEPSGTAQ